MHTSQLQISSNESSHKWRLVDIFVRLSYDMTFQYNNSRNILVGPSLIKRRRIICTPSYYFRIFFVTMKICTVSGSWPFWEARWIVGKNVFALMVILTNEKLSFMCQITCDHPGIYLQYIARNCHYIWLTKLLMSRRLIKTFFF